MKPFYVWLLEQHERQDFIGDVCRDFQYDSYKPRDPYTSYIKLRNYMKKCGACDEALEGLSTGWKEYKQKYQPK